MANKSKITSSAKSETAALRKQVAALNRKLEKYQQKDAKRKKTRLRTASKWTLLGLASLVFVTAVLVFYAALSLINTNRFMNLAGPLSEQKSVQRIVARRTTKALYDQINLEQLTADALPPRISFLAPTVSRQIRQQSDNQAEQLLASDKFQTIWRNSMRSAHERLIDGLANYRGDGTIDLQDVYTNLSSNISNDKLSFLSKIKLPPKYGQIVIVQSQWLGTASFIVSNLTAIRILTISLLLILLGLAVWVSVNRRKTITQIGILISSLSFLLLLAGRVVRTLLTAKVIPENQQMFLDVWKVFTTSFVTQMVTTLIFGLAVAFVAWIGGNSKLAGNIKNRISLLFNGKLHKSLFPKENSLTKFVGRYRTALLTAVGLVFVAGILVINYAWTSLISLIIVCLLLALSVEALAAEKS
jgi:hypothetical protein